MSKATLIVRAYNRLEYTIETLDSLIKTVDCNKHDILVVNNNSNDGTTEWLYWVQENSIFYKNKFRHYNPGRNLGGWYGFCDGLKHVLKDTDYVVQIDNDTKFYDQNWLEKMIYVKEETGVNMTMLRRIKRQSGVAFDNLPVSEFRSMKWNDETIELADASRPVCCFLIPKELLHRFHNDNPGMLSERSAYKVASRYGKPIKLMNVYVHCYLSDDKYRMENPKVWQKV